MVGTAQPGPWIMNLNDTGGWVKQDLGTTVNVGDTLSVTFSVMSDSEFGAIDASFLVGPTPAVYHLNFDTSDNGHSLNTWYNYTFTTAPITEAGNLSLQFSQVSGRLWLDNVSDVSVNLTAIPEPGSLLALGCLIGSAALLRNRRR